MRRRSWLIYTFQAVAVFGSLILAWLLRFDFALPYLHSLFSSGLLLVAVRLLALGFFRLDHGWWDFAGLSDAINIPKAVITGSLAFWVLNRYALGGFDFPRSVYLLEALLTMGVLAGMRLSTRLLTEFVHRDSPAARRVMLIGAGFAAQMVIRELGRPNSGYLAVGCVDDDASKRHIHINGVPVLGIVDQLGSILETHPVD